MTDSNDQDLPIVPDEVSSGTETEEAELGSMGFGDEPDGAADPLAGLFGGGGLDFGAIMETAGQMQAQMLAAQEQAASTVVEGVAGGGAVKIEVTGGYEFQSITISPDAVDPNDVEMLQDLVLAALRDATERITELQNGGGLDLGGLDLGGLGGLGGLGDLFGGS